MARHCQVRSCTAVCVIARSLEVQPLVYGTTFIKAVSSKLSVVAKAVGREGSISLEETP